MAARLRNDYVQDPMLADEVYEKLFRNSNDHVYIDIDEHNAAEILMIR